MGRDALGPTPSALTAALSGAGGDRCDQSDERQAVLQFILPAAEHDLALVSVRPCPNPVTLSPDIAVIARDRSITALLPLGIKTIQNLYDDVFKETSYLMKKSIATESNTRY